MLRRKPTISLEGTDAYFASINIKLTDYEQLLEYATMLLELVIWKSKITEHFGLNNDYPYSIDTKIQCRTASVSMLTIIVPNVLSFF